MHESYAYELIIDEVIGEEQDGDEGDTKSVIATGCLACAQTHEDDKMGPPTTSFKFLKRANDARSNETATRSLLFMIM